MRDLELKDKYAEMGVDYHPAYDAANLRKHLRNSLEFSD